MVGEDAAGDTTGSCAKAAGIMSAKDKMAMPPTGPCPYLAMVVASRRGQNGAVRGAEAINNDLEISGGTKGRVLLIMGNSRDST